MGISAFNYPYNSINIQQVGTIDNYRKSMRHNSTVLNNDVFIRTNASTVYSKRELERLFPNGELNNIYNNIINEYGLENVPQLEYIYDSKGENDYASANHITNKIKLNLDNLLSPNMYKFAIEKNGTKTFCYDEDLDRIKIIRTTDKNVLNEINEYNKYQGADKSEAIPLTDDDKRKLVIFTLAHELRHCYQNQIIRHTEGLDGFKMIELQLKNNPNKPKMNMIDEKIMYINLEKEYDKHHSKDENTKMYTQNSKEGKLAIEWYNAVVNYVDFNKDYEGYKNNAIELDANKTAHQYLIKNYGNFSEN